MSKHYHVNLQNHKLKSRVWLSGTYIIPEAIVTTAYERFHSALGGEHWSFPMLATQLRDALLKGNYTVDSISDFWLTRATISPASFGKQPIYQPTDVTFIESVEYPPDLDDAIDLLDQIGLLGFMFKYSYTLMTAPTNEEITYFNQTHSHDLDFPNNTSQQNLNVYTEVIFNAIQRLIAQYNSNVPPEFKFSYELYNAVLEQIVI